MNIIASVFQVLLYIVIFLLVVFIIFLLINTTKKESNKFWEENETSETCNKCGNSVLVTRFYYPEVGIFVGGKCSKCDTVISYVISYKEK